MSNRPSIDDYVVQGGTAGFTHLGTGEFPTLDEMLTHYSREQLLEVPLGVLRPEGRRRWRRQSKNYC
jgi:hypothetical protein